MNRWVHSVFGLSLAGLLALLALHGPALVATVRQAWALLHAIVQETPNALWAFGLALALAITIQPYLRNGLPAMRCPVTREFVIDTVALVVGGAAMWLQVPTLPGALLGGLAGLLSSYTRKGCVAALRLSQRIAAIAPRPRHPR